MVLNDSKIVGNLPGIISCVAWFFLRCSSHIVYRVSGERRHDNGLEVPCVYVDFGYVKTIIHVHGYGR